MARSEQGRKRALLPDYFEFREAPAFQRLPLLPVPPHPVPHTRAIFCAGSRGERQRVFLPMPEKASLPEVSGKCVGTPGGVLKVR